MSRMKTFFKYFLIVVLFYVFSNIMINAFFKMSYKDMTGYQIDASPVFVDVTEAKATKRNGYINGIVKNNTEATVENKYLKVSMLSKNNNVLGEKYIKIDKIEPKELRKFEVKFDYDNVKTFRIEMTDTKPEEVDFLELIKNNAKDLVSETIKK
ncbi:MAG: FxLYD domain-containing protein [Clostridia bacterium]|nr:FxLYD domain-containing protein [Clostridia bacterium]